MVKEYINQHTDQFLNELFELLRIPSISADSQSKKAMQQAAEYVRDRLQEIHLDRVDILKTKGHPIVYGEKIIDVNKPTILVYGHYDVQPPDPLNLWNTPPFEPTTRDGKIYARGACDDKGQFYMHIKAVEVMMENDLLACNVKFMIEGEEEIGSTHLESFIMSNKDRLKADIILISDTSVISFNQPSMTTSLRGLSYMEVEVIGANRDLHSGVYGGAVANPLNILCQLIASLHDKNGRVTIPSFYDTVVDLPAATRRIINQTPFDLINYKKELDVKELKGEDGYTTLEHIGIRPSLDVNGLWGGYTGEGAKTVLPAKAQAKISMRLVPNQSSKAIADLFTKHIQTIAPKSVKINIIAHHGGDPVVIQFDSKAFQAACQAFEEVWGKKPIPTRDGGSIPIVALFKKELGLDTIFMGFGLDTDAIHSPNEHFGIKNFLIGIETIVAFYKYFSKV